MRLSRALALAFASLLITSCGVPFPFVPTPEPVAPLPVEITEPPPLSINGVPGQPISFCWVNGCADGVWPPAMALPEVRAPLVMALPDGARVDGVSAYRAGPNAQPAPVDFAGNQIGPVPEGAVTLSVFVIFEGGGDAFYAWSIEPPEQP